VTAFADSCTRVYYRGSDLAHLQGPDGEVVCPMAPPLSRVWLGTGNMQETAKAARLELCRVCAARAAAVDKAAADAGAVPSVPPGGAR
jgi:hypothetical protein